MSDNKTNPFYIDASAMEARVETGLRGGRASLVAGLVNAVSSLQSGYESRTSDAQPVPLDAQYTGYVAGKLKDPMQLALEITPLKAHLNHMVMGIAGEAGELVDAIKKHTMYDKPIDLANVIEELGDLEFFMAGLRLQLGISRDQTIQGNMDKLDARYKGKFSNEEAQARADKA